MQEGTGVNDNALDRDPRRELEEEMAQHAELGRRLRELLALISFPDYTFCTRAAPHGTYFLFAWYFERDVRTAKMERQTTRRWLITQQMTDSEIVQTAFKLVLTSYEHRAREHFRYRDKRIFGPHFDVEDLVRLCEDGRNDAGGREP